MTKRKHLFVPDTQVAPGRPTDHIHWLAYYAMDKLTNDDVIVFAGDWYDLPSLSSYDKRGSRSFEGRRLRKDLQSGHDALDILWDIWSARGFEPETHITLGNHENRFYRALNDSPEFLEGMFEDDNPFEFEAMGWHAHKFLKPVIIDGIAYNHFWPHNARGGVTQTKHGAPCARAQAQRQMMSATAGHQQGFDYAVTPFAGGYVQGLIAGSFYLHNESYHMGNNNYWRGLILKHGVHKGQYDLCQVRMAWLKDKYKRFK